MLFTQTGRLTAFLIIATSLAGAFAAPAQASDLEAYAILEDFATDTDLAGLNAFAGAIAPDTELVLDAETDALTWADVEAFEIDEYAPEQDYALDAYAWDEEQEDVFGHIFRHLARHAPRIMRHLHRHAPRLLNGLKRHIARHGRTVFKHIRKHIMRHGRRIFKQIMDGKLGKSGAAPKRGLGKPVRVAERVAGGPAKTVRRPVRVTKMPLRVSPRPRVNGVKSGGRSGGKTARGRQRLEEIDVLAYEEAASAALAHEIILAIIATQDESDVEGAAAADFDIEFVGQVLQSILD